MYGSQRPVRGVGTEALSALTFEGLCLTDLEMTSSAKLASVSPRDLPVSVFPRTVVTRMHCHTRYLYSQLGLWGYTEALVSPWPGKGKGEGLYTHRVIYREYIVEPS